MRSSFCVVVFLLLFWGACDAVCHLMFLLACNAVSKIYCIFRSYF